MRFVWDLRKEVANIEKHGIAFGDAVRVFEGRTIDRIDDRFDYGEVRRIAVGVVSGLFISVVYTMRDDACRIISARRSTRHERQAWQRGDCE